MWTRKHLKHQAKKSLKSNYPQMVSRCFLTALSTPSTPYDRIFNYLICIFHFYFPAVSPGTANNFCSDTSEFSRCLQFLDRNRHAAARISDFVFRCTTGNSVRTHPQYIYQWKIFYLCHFKDCQRGLP